MREGGKSRGKEGRKMERSAERYTETDLEGGKKRGIHMVGERR